MSKNNSTNVLRNIGFALVSLVALEFIFWIYSSFLKFVIEAIVLNMSMVWIIILFLFLGGIIFGFIRMIGVGLALLYEFICKIATNKKFVIVWTEIWVVVGVIVNCYRLWTTSEFLTQGFMGIIGLIIISVNLGFLAVTLCQATLASIDGWNIEE
jgi:hypothetical protein